MLNHRFLLLVLGALTAFAPMSIDLYLSSLPSLEQSLRATPVQVQLTVSLFFIGFAFGQLVYGPLTDRYGRMLPLIAGLVLYILASIGCALATNIHVLIALRLVEALGACAGVVVSRAMVRDLFQGPDAARVFSSLMLVMGLAPIVAPLAGGYLLVWFGWRSNFWALSLFGMACLAGALLVLRETHPAAARTRGPAARGALREYRRILADTTFLRNALTSSLSSSGLFTYIAASPFVLMTIYKVPTHLYGWLFGLNALGLIIASQVNHRLLTRFGAETLLRTAGTVQCIAGLTLLSSAITGFGGLHGVLAPLFLFTTCMGFILPNATASALNGYRATAGSAAALIGTLQFGLGAAISALVGLFHQHSAVPMCAGIALCGIASAIVQRTVGRNQRAGVTAA